MEAEAEAFESFIKGRKLMRLPIHGAAKAVNSPTTNWWKIATSGRLLHEAQQVAQGAGQDEYAAYQRAIDSFLRKVSPEILKAILGR